MATPLPPDSAPPDSEAGARLHAWRVRAQLQSEQWKARELDWTTRLNRASAYRAATIPLAVASRLADGVLWYSTMAGLALLGGPEGRLCATRMALVGILCVTLYLWIKRVIARPRPFIRCEDIRVCARVLDQFSFPSGHALHAVAFTLIIVHSYPSMGYLLWPFVALVALSRVALGLHYPSDVLAGGLIGCLLAVTVLLAL